MHRRKLGTRLCSWLLISLMLLSLTACQSSCSEIEKQIRHIKSEVVKNKKISEIKIPKIELPKIDLPKLDLEGFDFKDIKLPDLKIGDLDLSDLNLGDIDLNKLDIASLPAARLHVQSEIEQSLEVSDLGSINKLKIDLDAASIKIKGYEGSTIKVDAKINLYAENQETLDLLKKEAAVAATQDKDEIIIDIADRKSGKNFKDAYEDKYEVFVGGALEIQVPSQIERWDLKCKLGAIEISNLKGSFDIMSEMGAISCKDITFRGESVISSKLGAVSVSPAADSSSDAHVKLSSELGGIELLTGGQAPKYEGEGSKLSHKAEMAGGTVFELENKLGSITVK